MPLQINVSDKAGKERKDPSELPVDVWFHVRITDVELRPVKSPNRDDGTPNPNYKKPMYNFTCEITDDERNPQDQDGKSIFNEYPFWVNACLWEGAEFTIVAIERALGREVKPGTLNIPDITDPDCELGGLEAYVGHEMLAFWGVNRKERNLANKQKRKPDPEWNRFKSADVVDQEKTLAASTEGAKPAARRRTLA